MVLFGVFRGSMGYGQYGKGKKSGRRAVRLAGEEFSAYQHEPSTAGWELPVLTHRCGTEPCTPAPGATFTGALEFVSLVRQICGSFGQI